MAKKLITPITYAEYFESNKWEAIQDAALWRADDECEICKHIFDSDHIPQVHHWVYPEMWENDSVENVVAICAQCHTAEHGYRADGVWEGDVWTNRTDYILSALRTGWSETIDDCPKCKRFFKKANAINSRAIVLQNALELALETIRGLKEVNHG